MTSCRVTQSLEVFATGLRNPQELAFDDFGNLFTGDNNSDGGDQARLVHVVRGSDTGWRMYYQYLGDRGPWNREKLWHPKHDEQPAYLVPPICNFGDGPSGLTYYPGTGLGETYKDTFFLCDFRGDAAMSGIRSFRFDPSGATFTLADSNQFLWNVLATDVDFGPDGSLYLTDWIEGWNGVNRGRVVRVSSPEHAAEGRRVAQLLQQDWSAVDTGQLPNYLGHADRRVRTKSQFELARRGVIPTLEPVVTENPSVLAKLHATWALGQIARTGSSGEASKAVDALLHHVESERPEIRKATLDALDNANTAAAMPAFTKALDDEQASVRAAAALGISRFSQANVKDRLVKLLQDNNDRDPVLRHAGIMALAGTYRAEELAAFQNATHAAVRRAAVVALRRQQSPRVALFLRDADSSIVREAALAIHDTPIADAFVDLAALIDGEHLRNDALTRRVLNANFRLGTAEHAQAVASVLGRDDVSTVMQLEALDMLRRWGTPSNRDRVLGDWRPLDARDGDIAKDAVLAGLQEISRCAPEVAIELVHVAAGMGIADVAEIALQMIGNDEYAPQKRAALLQPLAKLQPSGAKQLADVALRDPSEVVRSAARQLLVTIDADRAVEELTRAITLGSVVEQQSAFATLAGMEDQRADAALRSIADSQVVPSKLPPEVMLDAYDAMEKRGLDSVTKLIRERLNDKPYGLAHLATYGGDADRGMNVFSNNITLSCTRCHKAGRSGGRVGPNLAGLGAKKSPEYLLESIVDPNKVIAEGFGTLVVVTEDGVQKQGVLQKESDEYVQLVDAEGKQFLVMKAEIEDRANGKSAMPEDLTKELSLFDLRDLVAFLHSLKTPWDDPAGHD